VFRAFSDFDLQKPYSYFLPLTPALSLGERENPLPSLGGLLTLIPPTLICLIEKPKAEVGTKAFE
jgi:hypothetical protein